MAKPVEERRCHVCREKSLRRVVIPYEEEVSHDGRTITLRVSDLEVIKCVNPDCHPDQPSDTVILDGDALRRLDHETYRQLGLLAPDAIRAGRERLGMTQQELQDLLRLGSNSLSRWESGAVYQSRSLDKLLRIVFGVSEAVEFLKSSRSSISDATYHAVEIAAGA